MKKVIDYSLEYFDKGEEVTKKVKIKFVSNRVQREYNELMSEVARVQDCYLEMQKIKSEMVAIRLKKDKDYKRVIAEKQERDSELKEEINETDSKGFFKKRYELIKRILIDNGYGEDKVSTYEFWDESIEPSMLMDFLTTAVFKDVVETKKK